MLQFSENQVRYYGQLYNDYNSPIVVLIAKPIRDSSTNRHSGWVDTLDTALTQRCHEEGTLDKRFECEYTYDMGRYEESQVVLFKGRRLDQMSLPTRRSYEQRWVFCDFEPPNKVWGISNLTKYNGIFNITATYSLHSDIPINNKARKCVRDQSTRAKLNHYDYAKKKGNDVLVTWFVSVCNTQSRR